MHSGTIRLLIVNVYKNAASYRSVENRRFVYKLREVVWILISTECYGIIRTYGFLKVALQTSELTVEISL